MRNRITTAVAATAALAFVAVPTIAGNAHAAAPRISVSTHTVQVGQKVGFTAAGLNPDGGYYVMLCQNQPAGFPICARPGAVRNSFVHLSNRDTKATPIGKDGTAAGTLTIAVHDTSLLGPIPNDTRVDCSFGGCSIAVVEDHQHAKAFGGMLPHRVAATPVTVR